MTIADNLQTLIDCKADMKSAIESKGVTVSGGLSTYADAIREIEHNNNVIEIDNTIRFGFSQFEIAPMFDTSEFSRMNRMFEHCNSLKDVPLYDTSRVTDMSYMFYDCQSLITVPLFDTSRVTDMSCMFADCHRLTSVPQFNTSRVTNMYQMFCGSDIIQLPQFDTSKVSNMNGMIGVCYELIEIPLLDAGSITQMGMCRIYAADSSTVFSLPTITNLGGFKDLGKQANLGLVNDSSFLVAMPNLTRQSLLNVINNLYDRAEAGYSITSIKFNTKHLNLLTSDDIAIATAKGWNITA